MAVTNLYQGIVINVTDPPYSVIGDGSDEASKLIMVRPDKFKYWEAIIHNANGTYNINLRDYVDTTTVLALPPGKTAHIWNDGVAASYYAVQLD